MKIRAADIAFIAMCLWGAGAGAVSVYGRVRGPRADGRTPVTLNGPVDNWRDAVEGEHPYGPEDAATTIVVFSDFQCPFCKQFATTLDSIRNAFPQVRVVERHYPLDIHPQ